MRSGYAALIAATLVTAFTGSAAQAQKPVALVVVDVEAVALGFRASELVGRSVRNDRNEDIGRIDDIIVSKDRVLYAILSVGGFLGIGDRLVAVPYSSLRIDANKIVLPGATKQALEQLPQFRYAA